MEPKKDLARAALLGETISGEVIVDCHMHNGRVANFFSHFDYYRDLIAQMDRIGVTSGMVSNLWTTGEIWKAHPELHKMCETYPGRFWGYLAPNPHYEGWQEEMERLAGDPHFCGVKLHPVLHRLDLACDAYRSIYAWAGEQGLPVLLHTWGQEVLRFDELARQFPSTVFILGHSGGEEDAVKSAIGVAARNEHVYLDTACSYVWHGAVEAMVEEAGAHKVLYGSDAYWNSMEAAIGRVLFAQITDEQKRLILGLNAYRLFHLGQTAATV